MVLTQAKTLMHPESDYGRRIGGCFANASAASPPAVYFAKQPPILHLLSTGTNVMGRCLSKCSTGTRVRCRMVLTQAKTLMHPESDYGRRIGGCFANASAASPPAVYFAKQLPILRLLSTGTNVMGRCLSNTRVMPRRLRRLRFTHSGKLPNGTYSSQNTDASGVRLRSKDCGLFRECLGGFAACGLLRDYGNECHGAVLK